MPHSSTAGRRGRFPASPETQPLGLLNRVNWSEVVWHLFKQGLRLSSEIASGKLSEQSTYSWVAAYSFWKGSTFTWHYWLFLLVFSQRKARQPRGRIGL